MNTIQWNKIINSFSIWWLLQTTIYWTNCWSQARRPERCETGTCWWKYCEATHYSV